MRPAPAGYTLIELLVVISIISIMAMVGFVNYKDFAADQILVKAQGQLQSALRLAQANATSSVKCSNSGATSWRVFVLNSSNYATAYVICDPGATTVSSYTMDNVQVAATGSGCSFNIFLSVNYSMGNGMLASTCNSITFTLSNVRVPSTPVKTFTISKGGAIDVQ